MRPALPADAVELNRRYYDTALAGREDYWRLMAAPRHRVDTLLGLLEQRPPHTLIDLGCGGGQLLEEVGRRFPGAELAGLDLSPDQLERTRQNLPRARFFVGDLERPEELVGLPRFDTLVASEVIEHLKTPVALLLSARALAQPEARLLLSTQTGRIGQTERLVGHQRHFDAAELGELLSAAGWRAVALWNTGFPFHDLSKWWANLAPERSIERFGQRPYGRLERLVCSLLRAAFRLNSHRRGAQLFAVAELRSDPEVR